jgi:hypothetical protein
MGSRAWNAWYHCTASTYGTWLRGDPRGWRTRHHREHVEGDYKSPPAPGTGEALYALSKRLMTRDPVRLQASLRQIVADSIVRELESMQCPTVIAAMGSKHLHLLTKFDDHNPRKMVGIAKKRATQALKAHCTAVGLDLNLETGQGIWGKRSKAVPVLDRDHQMEVVRYIARHIREHAAIALAERLEIKRSSLLEHAFARR